MEVWKVLKPLRVSSEKGLEKGLNLWLPWISFRILPQKMLPIDSPQENLHLIEVFGKISIYGRRKTVDPNFSNSSPAGDHLR